MAQWIRRWSTEPEILGSIPSGVVFSFWHFRFISSSPSWTSAGCSTAAATLIHRWFHSLVSGIESQFLCTGGQFLLYLSSELGCWYDACRQYMLKSWFHSSIDGGHYLQQQASCSKVFPRENHSKVHHFTKKIGDFSLSELADRCCITSTSFS